MAKKRKTTKGTATTIQMCPLGEHALALASAKTVNDLSGIYDLTLDEARGALIDLSVCLSGLIERLRLQHRIKVEPRGPGEPHEREAPWPEASA